MDQVAKSFHHKNLERALEQFAKGERVTPLISFLKDGESWLVTKSNGTIEATLKALNEKVEPDAVNFVIVPSGPVPFSNDGSPAVLKQVLFAITYDHLGGRCVSMFEVKREGDSVKVEDIGPKGAGSRQVIVRTTPEGDLDIRVDSMPPKDHNSGQ